MKKTRGTKEQDKKGGICPSAENQPMNEDGEKGFIEKSTKIEKGADQP